MVAFGGVGISMPRQSKSPSKVITTWASHPGLVLRANDLRLGARRENRPLDRQTLRSLTVLNPGDTEISRALNIRDSITRWMTSLARVELVYRFPLCLLESY